MDDAYCEESHSQSSLTMLRAGSYTLILCLDMSCTLLKTVLASPTMKDTVVQPANYRLNPSVHLF